MKGHPLLYLRQACKPGSVAMRYPARGLMHLFRHLSSPGIAVGVIRPTPRLGRAALRCRYTRSFNPSGVRLPASPSGPVSSYLTFSPLPHPGAGLLFSVTLLYPFGYLPVRKDGALCCPDFPPRHKCRGDGPACHAAKIQQSGRDQKIFIVLIFMNSRNPSTPSSRP